MGDITYISLGLLTLLVIPTLFFNRFLKLRINKKISIGVIRMFVQLGLVGIYLQYLFDWNNAFLNVGYMLIMMLIASFSISSSTELKSLRARFGLYLSVFAATFLVLFFLNFVVLRLQNVFDARYLITIGGMILGNVLRTDIVWLNAYYKGIRENTDIVNYDLALGATREQALRPYFRDAVMATIRPSVASMETIGLVALPGMMTGQILGGSLPANAIGYQMAIMIAIYVSVYLNIIISISITQRLVFSDKDQLILIKAKKVKIKKSK